MKENFYTIECVPNKCKTREMCNEVVEEDPLFRISIRPLNCEEKLLEKGLGHVTLLLTGLRPKIT